MDEAQLLDETPGGLESPRLQFFLRNQAQIQEWQALANEVWVEVAVELSELKNSALLGHSCAERGIEAGNRVAGETATGPVLHRPAWCLESPGTPDIGVALGWDGRVDPSGMWPRTVLPYVGILASHVTDSGAAVAKRLVPLVAQKLSSAAGSGFKRGSHWAVYRLVAPSPNWWQSVDAWRDSLISELLRTWDVWAPVVDEASLGAESLGR